MSAGLSFDNYFYFFFLRLSQRRSQLTRGVTIKRNTLPSSLLLTTILTGNVRYNLFNFSFTTSQQIIFKQILINTFCWGNNHCNGYNFMRIIDCRTPHFRGRKIRAEFDIRVEQAEVQDVRVRAGFTDADCRGAVDGKSLAPFPTATVVWGRAEAATTAGGGEAAAAACARPFPVTTVRARLLTTSLCSQYVWCLCCWAPSLYYC